MKPKTPPKKIPNILYITGMNSSGIKPKILATMGYNVKTLSTTSNVMTATLGRFKRYIAAFEKQINGLGQQFIQENIAKHDREIQGFVPDVVVGTSQGGAVAMKLGSRYPKAKFVLNAPAWKIFNAIPENLPSDTIVLQGKKDMLVPFQDSMELKEKYGFNVRIFDDLDHQIPFPLVKMAIDKQLRSV
jgi:predicted esterase